VANGNPGLKLEMVTREFNAMLAELAAIDPRVEFAPVVRSEAGNVAALAMTGTKAAKVASIKARAEGRRFTTFNGKTYFLGNHYPNGLWGDIDRQNQDGLQTRLNARGISKQSWAHVSRSMGLNPKAPAYVLAANYRGNQYSIDGQSSEEGSGTSFQLTIINSSPVVQNAGGQWALIRAMSRRARFFERNMAHKFYLSIDTRAKKYPGIFTSPVPAPADTGVEVGT
jgi:hypothetical protein